MKRRRFVRYSTKRRFVVFFNSTRFFDFPPLNRAVFHWKKERRPSANASRASPTTPISPRLSRRAAPNGTVRRSKNFRVLATFFESVVPVVKPPPTVATTKQRKKTFPLFAKTPILTKQAAKKPAPRRFPTSLCRDATPRTFGRFVVDRSSQALGASR